MGLRHFYFRAFYLVKYKNNSGYHTAFHTIGCTKSFIYHALTPHNDAVEWSFFFLKKIIDFIHQHTVDNFWQFIKTNFTFSLYCVFFNNWHHIPVTFLKTITTKLLLIMKTSISIGCLQKIYLRKEGNYNLFTKIQKSKSLYGL